MALPICRSYLQIIVVFRTFCAEQFDLQGFIDTVYHRQAIVIVEVINPFTVVYLIYFM